MSYELVVFLYLRNVFVLIPVWEDVSVNYLGFQYCPILAQEELWIARYLEKSVAKKALEARVEMFGKISCSNVTGHVTTCYFNVLHITCFDLIQPCLCSLEIIQ